MRLTARVQRLRDKLPRCDGRTLRLAGPDHVPSEADRCRWCGGCHVLVIEEVTVDTHEEALAVLARNNATGDGP